MMTSCVGLSPCGTLRRGEGARCSRADRRAARLIHEHSVLRRTIFQAPTTSKVSFVLDTFSVKTSRPLLVAVGLRCPSTTFSSQRDTCFFTVVSAITRRRWTVLPCTDIHRQPLKRRRRGHPS